MAKIDERVCTKLMLIKFLLGVFTGIMIGVVIGAQL